MRAETKSPHVLHVTPAWVDTLCAGFQLLKAAGYQGDVPEADALRLGGHGGDRRSARALENQADNISLKYGTARSYLQARLERDTPEIAQALARGDYPSVHAAAKAAGFIKDPAPLTLLHRAWAKATPAERTTFLADITPGGSSA